MRAQFVAAALFFGTCSLLAGSVACGDDDDDAPPPEEECGCDAGAGGAAPGGAGGAGAGGAGAGGSSLERTTCPRPAPLW
ncbi:MAG TPA: hypothetical protein VFS43_36220 [Polyangiaceae bacterium]|nr:hypothetical protein [Polyangiaceae bacterium]